MKIHYYFLDFFIFRLPLVRTLISIISDLINLIIFLFLKKSAITGEKRFIARVFCLLQKKRINTVFITNKGIYAEEKLLARFSLPVILFIPPGGIYIKNEDLPLISEIIRRNIPDRNSTTAASYLRTRWLFIFSMSIYLFVNFFVLIQIAGSYNLYYLIVRRIQFVNDIIWYVTNLFFLIQLYIYFKVVIKGISITHRFQKVEPISEKGHQSSENQPGVIILLPAYKEDAFLLRRVLLSLFLQTYGNKKIVVLLDEDEILKTNAKVGSQEEIITMVEALQKELFFIREKVREKMQYFVLHTRDIGQIKMNYLIVEFLAQTMVDWITQNSAVIRDSETHYPIDKFFYKEVINERLHYFSTIVQWISKILENSEHIQCMESGLQKLTTIFNEYGGFIHCDIELFMRSHYVNVASEQTKAANLSTYCSLINKEWKADSSNKEGKKHIVIKGESKEYFAYVAILDADVIVKPSYLLKKITFLENNENRDCGLIQSPYIVPAYEGNRVADATGVHNDWFFPYSVGLNYYNSVFWLGYNGVFRYDIVKDMDFFSAKTVVEDIELSLKIRQKNYTIFTTPEEECMTFSPVDLSSLEVQRKRWASGCLRIAFIFIKGLLEKKYPSLSFKEFFFRFMYILNLNLLPVFSTLLYFTVLSVSRDLVIFLILPWVVYITCLFNMERIKKQRKVSQIIDSILIYFYMNSFHLRGLIRSFKNLFITEKFFLSTPKKIGYKINRTASHIKRMPLKYFELFEILFITFFYIFMSVENLFNGLFYLQIFPVYYIIITYAGITRLVGMKHFIYSLFYRFILTPIKYIRGFFKTD